MVSETPSHQPSLSQALPLMGLLLFIFPIALLAGESLFIPLSEFIRTVTLPADSPFKVILPYHFFIKLGCFSVLAFLGVFQLVQRIRLLCLQTWMARLSQPDILHVPYHADTKASMVSLLSWHLYRVWLVLGTPIIASIVASILAVAGMYAFGLLINIPAALLSLFMILGLFLLFTTGFVLMVLFARGLWLGVISAYGDIIAIAEPELPSKVIIDRCVRLCGLSPWVIALYTAYTVFALFFGVLAWLFLAVVDINDLFQLFQGRFPFLWVLLAEAGLLGFFLALDYATLQVYHHAMQLYYGNLPQAFRHRFLPVDPQVFFNRLTTV